MIRLNGELPFFLKVDGLQHQQRVLKSSFLYKSFEASEKRGETKLIFKIKISIYQNASSIEIEKVEARTTEIQDDGTRRVKRPKRIERSERATAAANLSRHT